MADDTTTDEITLRDAANSYLASLKTGSRTDAAPEVLKFVRWNGAERTLASLRGHEVAAYGDEIAPSVADAAARAESVRAFLKWAKDRGHTAENMGRHLRVRKSTKSSSNAQTLEEQPVYLTRQGYDGLVAEHEELKARRPQIQQDLARAMADKDFRENAPLDAARNEQAHLEARIREIEVTLRKAVVLDGSNAVEANVDIARIGDAVTIRDLRTGGEKTYTLVNTDEVRAGQGKISIASPVGKAVYQHRVGEEVDVEAPAGTFRVRIESIAAP